ncbi:MAG TPA: thioredoxin family protein [Candidatus Angelobacter sp.]|nr:thioredoxin family protein [Candidatus Angelobacter sp.]
MRVTVLYVEDCPSWRVADRRLAEALRAVGLGGVVVDRRLVTSDEEARRTGFSGSPTILLDGVDPFHEGADDAVGLSCRLYRTPSGLAGSPTLDQLVEVLAAAAAST